VSRRKRRRQQENWYCVGKRQYDTQSAARQRADELNNAYPHLFKYGYLRRYRAYFCADCQYWHAGGHNIDLTPDDELPVIACGY
jgi:hypothetical protein